MKKTIEPDEISEEDVSAVMAALGRIGGSSRSEKKRKAVRANLEKARKAKERLRGERFEPDPE